MQINFVSHVFLLEGFDFFFFFFGTASSMYLKFIVHSNFNLFALSVTPNFYVSARTKFWSH